MNDGNRPDLLCVCEVENRFVLDLLVNVLTASLPTRQYTVIHADTDNDRGVDVTFIYGRRLFSAIADEVSST